MLLMYALLLSIVVAIVSHRRLAVRRAALIVVGAALAFTVLQYFTLDAVDLPRQLVRASFVVVPSVILFGASRAVWFAQHAWVLVLAGPLTFAGCYLGLCGIYVSTGIV
jgi:hypothetical protein